MTEAEFEIAVVAFLLIIASLSVIAVVALLYLAKSNRELQEINKELSKEVQQFYRERTLQKLKDMVEQIKKGRDAER